MRHVKVGDIVYEAYTPSQVGIVIEVIPENPSESKLKEVVYRKIDGRTKQTNRFSFYDELIAGHKRKYETQQAIYNRLRELYGDP